MDIDLPDVLAEVDDRVRALRAGAGRQRRGDARRAVLATMRAPSATAIGEILYGYDEIAAFRAARSPVGLARTLSRTVITTYGRDFATASTLFERDSVPGKIGRQMQTWVRIAGWLARGCRACEPDRGVVRRVVDSAGMHAATIVTDGVASKSRRRHKIGDADDEFPCTVILTGSSTRPAVARRGCDRLRPRPALRAGGAAGQARIYRR